MSLISRGETGSRQPPVIMRAYLLLYHEFNHLGFLSTGSDFDADPQLKHSRRLATRYDKTADSFLGFVVVASIRLWIRHFVHTT